MKAAHSCDLVCAREAAVLLHRKYSPCRTCMHPAVQHWGVCFDVVLCAGSSSTHAIPCIRD